MKRDHLAGCVTICVVLAQFTLTTCDSVDREMLVSTGIVTNITQTTAGVSGTIIDMGEGATQHGHCYGVSPGVSVSGPKTTLGPPIGKGVYSSQLTGLQPGTTYYVKAFLSDGKTTSYGGEISFTTLPVALPQLTTAAATSVTATTAISGGNISGDGGSGVIARGVCWSTTENPTTSGNTTSDGTGTGSFVSNLTGLNPNTTYFVKAYATNNTGTAYGSQVSFTTQAAATVPGAPTGVSAAGGYEEATVTFSAPVNEGGSAITGYTVTSSPGGFVGTGTSSPITVTGLPALISYTFTVTATNVNGTGPASVASNSVTPTTTPGSPTIGTATAGNLQATVTFTPPASDGGLPITGYTVTSNPGGITATGTASPIIVTGLSNIAYTFTVTATNANGAGASSASSNSVTITTVPGAPTIGTATKGNAQATVTFIPPASNGGSAITGYTATSSPGGITGTAASSPITVTGLTNGTAYTFTVVATNINGNSAPSAASNSVTPSTVPGAPTSVTATAGNAQATVSFAAPSSNGGSAITGYTVTSNPGGITRNGTSSPITVTGLTNLTSYTFTVVATNINGNSAPSASSNSVIPGTATNSTTGKIWLDRNLGATQVATSSTDVNAYGDLYQWGRRTDGHQARGSGTTSTLSNTDTPPHGNFILAPNSPFDWRNPQNANLWQGVSGTNNPCPTGYRLPTEAELNLERLSWSTNNSSGAFASPLKLPMAGYRHGASGLLDLVGEYGGYWTSTVSSGGSRHLYFQVTGAAMSPGTNRSLGFSVRCIKD